MLCICNNIPEELKNDSFEVNGVYRSCNGETGWKFVYGVQMIDRLYSDNFRSLSPEEESQYIYDSEKRKYVKK
jgi:hypothetical protein